MEQPAESVPPHSAMEAHFAQPSESGRASTEPVFPSEYVEVHSAGRWLHSELMNSDVNEYWWPHMAG